MNADPDTLTVEDLLSLKRQQMLVVNPEYQRGVVWTQSQQKKLVDSVLRGYPIPLIYLHHIKQQAGGLSAERYEVIDGQQRITALWEFVEVFGPLEREIPYYRQRKKCGDCGGTVVWSEAEIHHVDIHSEGGPTNLENGAMVHRSCHPKGATAVERFATTWRNRQSSTESDSE